MKMRRVNENDYEYMKYILTSIMDMGEILLTHGAEVSRVEDTIGRLCRAYGFVRSDVFTITSSVIVTAILPDGRTVTQTRRIRERDTDLGRVEQVNALSRKICTDPLCLEEFQNEVRKLREKKNPSLLLQLVMYMMISASLSVFFGGTAKDGVAAAVSGVVLFFTLYESAALKLNSLIQTMLCSAFTSVAVMLLVRIGIGTHPDKIMIGNIMLVIPGIQLTNSLRDMISGDMISGLLNMSEALMKAISVAMGFALGVLFGGGIWRFM